MNSILKKQFYSFTVTIVLCLLFMSLGIIQAIKTFGYSQLERETDVCGERVQMFFDNAINEVGALDTAAFIQAMQPMNTYSDKLFVVTDPELKVYWCSDGVQKSLTGVKLEFKKIDKTLKGDVIELKKNTLGIYDENMYTKCYPLNDKQGNVCGVVCISSTRNEMTRAMISCYRIFAVFLAFTILIGFLMVYMSSKALAAPLKEMNEAAKVIASGDFEKRIRINYDDEIGQLANSFNEMASSLYLQEKSRREFLSNISHDLRSPLTSMRGFLQAILDGTIPEDKRDRYLHIIMDETDRLAKLANNMLEINKLEETEKLNIKTFDINELASRTLEPFEERAAKLLITLTTDFYTESCPVSADEEKIQRVIYNLVDNALKFTHKYGIIRIITRPSHDGKKVLVTVKDNGKGVSKDEQKKVFDRLYKADVSRGKDKKGTGLGLSIVREFIKAHNETITLKSDVGKGCEFTFTLTLAK